MVSMAQMRIVSRGGMSNVGVGRHPRPRQITAALTGKPRRYFHTGAVPNLVVQLIAARCGDLLDDHKFVLIFDTSKGFRQVDG